MYPKQKKIIKQLAGIWNLLTGQRLGMPKVGRFSPLKNKGAKRPKEAFS